MVEKTEQDGASHARQEGSRTKESTGQQIASEGPQMIGGEWSFRKRPDFLKERVDYFATLFEAQKEKYAAMPHNPITVTMPDGKVNEGVSFETTPFDIAKAISSQFAKKVLVCQVRYPNGRIATLDDKLMNPEEDKASQGEGWIFFDMARPFEGNCELKMFTFDDAEGKETFWHSSAHVLGESLEIEFGVHLTHGPPTDSGFFYDSYTGGDKFSEATYK
jgi:threonyl-tRNA synthetase